MVAAKAGRFLAREWLNAERLILERADWTRRGDYWRHPISARDEPDP